MIHLPNSFTDPEETACGLAWGPVTTRMNRTITERVDWWQVNCARCLNSEVGAALLEDASTTGFPLDEATALLDVEKNARTFATAAERLTLSRFDGLHLHSGGWNDHLNGVPVP